MSQSIFKYTQLALTTFCNFPINHDNYQQLIQQITNNKQNCKNQKTSANSSQLLSYVTNSANFQLLAEFSQQQQFIQLQYLFEIYKLEQSELPYRFSDMRTVLTSLFLDKNVAYNFKNIEMKQLNLQIKLEPGKYVLNSQSVQNFIQSENDASYQYIYKGKQQNDFDFCVFYYRKIYENINPQRRQTHFQVEIITFFNVKQLTSIQDLEQFVLEEQIVNNLLLQVQNMMHENQTISIIKQENQFSNQKQQNFIPLVKQGPSSIQQYYNNNTGQK